MIVERFNPEADCSKCGYGYEGISSSYHVGCSSPGCLQCHQINCPVKEAGGGEHILRTCRRCSFCWVELTLDYEITKS